MTRFARAAGSKSSNKKTAEDATPWDQLRGGLGTGLDRGETDASTKNEQARREPPAPTSAGGNTWSVMQDSAETKQPSSDSSQPPSKKTRVDCGNGDGTIERESTEADDATNKKKKKKEWTKVCFKCRGGGHLLKDCPLESDSPRLCFSCGSTEHELRKCPKKGDGSALNFAQCWVCKQTGHLSANCPDNPKGLYPEGGSCSLCGEVTHYARNCPQRASKRRRRNTEASAELLHHRNVEGLTVSAQRSPLSPTPPPLKTVKF